MAYPHFLHSLSHPTKTTAENWVKFLSEEHISNVVTHSVASIAAIYHAVPGPLDKSAYQRHDYDKDFLAIYQADEPINPKLTTNMVTLKLESELFGKAEDTDRNRTMFEVGESESTECKAILEFPGPRHVEGAPPFILQFKFHPTTDPKVDPWLAVAHVETIAKRAGYRQTIEYRSTDASWCFFMHEFDDLDGLDGLNDEMDGEEWADVLKENFCNMEARAFQLVRSVGYLGRGSVAEKPT